MNQDSRFNYAPDNFLQLPQERYSASAFAHFYVTDEHRIYSEVSFIRNYVPQELAPTPAFTTIEINPNSAFFSPEVQQAFLNSGDLNADGNYEAFIGRRMVENGSRQSLDTRDAFRILSWVSTVTLMTIGHMMYYYSRSMLDQTNLLKQ